jgi:XTP/dITP diphosphohydrolase
MSRVALRVATRNPGKVREIAALLADLPLDLSDAAEMDDVAETGTTFEENAALKARAAARHFGQWALADDSGLEVDALDGAPGIYSARYGGRPTDAARNELLLEHLAGVPDAARAARFRAAAALAAPDGRVWVREGACEGRIARAPRGEGGFGYDPLFYLPEYGCTMAELPPATKNRISHRARALAALRPLLERLVLDPAEGRPEEASS